MNLNDSYVTITIPWWRIRAARVFLFLAWTVGVGKSANVHSAITTWLSRGARVEFVVE